MLYDSHYRDGMRFVNNQPSRFPMKGEVQVQVYSAGLNPIDYKIPEIPFLNMTRNMQAVGVDFAGVVTRLGRNV